MLIDVTYMSGAGNLFTVIDNRKIKLSKDDLVNFAPLLCNKSDRGILKTDGLISIINGSDDLDFIAEFFNPDGSYGAMCGNGSRCAVMFAKMEKIIPRNSNLDIIKFEMAGKTYTAQLAADVIRVYFPPPAEIIPKLIVKINNLALICAYVNVGSDHLVIKKEDVLEFKDLALDDIPLSDFAPQLRLHPDFSPRGVNVNVYSILDKNVIQLRTYERGVEGETAACGTGTISTALIAASKGEVTFPVTVIPKSGIPLVVDTIYNSHQEIESIILEGTAEIIGHAQIEIAL